MSRIETLVGFGTDKVQGTLIADAIDLIIYIKKTANRRTIEEIVEVINYDTQIKEYITAKLA